MKKTIILLLTLIGLLIIPLTISTYNYTYLGTPKLRSLAPDNVSKVSELKEWEYVKTFLFPIGKKVVPKFKGPI